MPNRPPATPTLVSPANGATGISLTPTLQASAFSDPDAGDTHANSQWQVDNGNTFASAEWDSGQSFTAGTQVPVPSGKLSANTTYYWRVRYQDKQGNWSDWSASRSFTTLDRAPATPTLVSPANAATGISLTPTLQAAAFSDPDAGDTHANSQWQVDNSSSFSSPEWDSGQSYAAGTQVTVPSGKLSANTTYYWRVRYKDGRGTWSEWSTARSFTTLNNPPATPTLVGPANAAIVVSLTPALQASAFSDPDAGDTHAGSQWQVDNHSSFASPEWDSGQSYAAGTQVSVPSGKLSAGTTYYWRVRYKDNRGTWSNWSASWSLTTAQRGGVLYVDAHAPAGGDGTAWSKAFPYLQNALAAASASRGAIQEIRVAAGTYLPHLGADPSLFQLSATFQLLNGVALKGGYAGMAAGGDPNTRDIHAHETILSGDLKTGPDPWDEQGSRHVVSGSGTDSTAVLDGFTITAGGVKGLYTASQYGGGLYNVQGSPTVRNCTFFDNNTRGTVYFPNGPYPEGYGGAVYNQGSHPWFENCTFRGNGADYGAAAYNEASQPVFLNCLFVGNRAEEGGALAATRGSTLILTNCTFAGNKADQGRALSGGPVWQNLPSTMTITNCILWDDGQEIWNPDGSAVTIAYSDVAGGPSLVHDPKGRTVWGTGNLQSDPGFVQPGRWVNYYDPNLHVQSDDPNALWVEGDCHLKPGSPCIDKGDPTYKAEPDNVDLGGGPRVIHGRIDIGAYEAPEQTPLTDLSTSAVAAPREAGLPRSAAGRRDRLAPG